MIKALAALLGVVTACIPPASWAQAWPAKPVRVIVAAAPGGITDILGRLLDARLQERLKQPFLTDNRGGAAGSIAAAEVAKSAPDGYTLIMTNDQLVVQASFASKLPYDPITDFAPVGIMARGPVVLGVHPSVPAKTVQELVALVRSQPGKYAFASCGNGTVLHLAGELLNLEAGIDLAHIPYKGCGPAMTDAVAGQVPVFFTVLGNAVPFAKTGKVRLLGVASLQRLKSYPDLPTIAEAGFQGYDAYPWFGLLAPAHTPREIVAKLASEMVSIVDSPDINEKIRGYYLEPQTATPEAFLGIMKADLARWSRVVRQAKLHLD